MGWDRIGWDSTAQTPPQQDKRHPPPSELPWRQHRLRGGPWGRGLSSALPPGRPLRCASDVTAHRRRENEGEGRRSFSVLAAAILSVRAGRTRSSLAFCSSCKWWGRPFFVLLSPSLFYSPLFIDMEAKQRGNGGDAERGVGWDGRAACVVSALRSAPSAPSGGVDGEEDSRHGSSVGGLCGGLGRAELGSAGLTVPGARPGGGTGPSSPAGPGGLPGERGVKWARCPWLGVAGVTSRICGDGLWPSQRNKPLTSSACQDFGDRH